jgi:hypothetical protein
MRQQRVGALHHGRKLVELGHRLVLLGRPDLLDLHLQQPTEQGQQWQETSIRQHTAVMKAEGVSEISE